MEKKLCKKCGIELPVELSYKRKLCEECNEKRKNIIKKILIGAGVGAAAIAAVLVKVASKSSEDINDVVDNCDFDYDYDDDEDGYSESLSVWDAADIYLSSGFDEDYSFGYTHEELTNTLK